MLFYIHVQKLHFVNLLYEYMMVIVMMMINISPGGSHLLYIAHRTKCNKYAPLGDMSMKIRNRALLRLVNDEGMRSSFSC